MGDRLRSARIKAGFKSARAAALKHGWTPSTYAAHENGQNEFDPATAAKYGKAFKVSAGWLMTGGDSGAPPMGTISGAKLIKRNLREVPVVGKAAAGVFREVIEYDDLEPELILAERDREFPNARMFALEVEGDSMNAADPPILDGAKVICVDFEDTGLPVMDGLLVAVERTRDGGFTREWTIKEVELHDDRTEYHPRSTNKRHRPIVVPHDAEVEGEEVRILGLVVSVSNPVRRHTRLPA